MVISRFLHLPRRAQLMERVAQSRDARMIGPLLDYLTAYDSILTPLALDGLTAILPHVRNSNANLLTLADRTRLRRLVSSKRKSLVLAILTAYRQVGDSRDAPAVRSLASMPTPPSGSVDRTRRLARSPATSLEPSAHPRSPTSTRTGASFPPKSWPVGSGSLA